MIKNEHSLSVKLTVPELELIQSLLLNKSRECKTDTSCLMAKTANQRIHGHISNSKKWIKNYLKDDYTGVYKADYALAEERERKERALRNKKWNKEVDLDDGSIFNTVFEEPCKDKLWNAEALQAPATTKPETKGFPSDETLSLKDQGKEDDVLLQQPFQAQYSMKSPRFLAIGDLLGLDIELQISPHKGHHCLLPDSNHTLSHNSNNQNNTLIPLAPFQKHLWEVLKVSSDLPASVCEGRIERSKDHLELSFVFPLRSSKRKSF